MWKKGVKWWHLGQNDRWYFMTQTGQWKSIGLWFARLLNQTWAYISHYQISMLALCRKKNRFQHSYLDLQKSPQYVYGSTLPHRADSARPISHVIHYDQLIRQLLLMIPITRLSFSISKAAPSLWNALSCTIRACDSLDTLNIQHPRRI